MYSVYAQKPKSTLHMALLPLILTLDSSKDRNPRSQAGVAETTEGGVESPMVWMSRFVVSTSASSRKQVIHRLQKELPRSWCSILEVYIYIYMYMHFMLHDTMPTFTSTGP